MASSIVKYYKNTLVDGKLIRVHRAVMENHLGRKLLSTEIVHHKDGDKLNNDITNLEITTRQEHASMHWKGVPKPKPGEYKQCVKCNILRYLSPSVAVRTNTEYKCKKCYVKFSKKRNNGVYGL